MDYKHTHIISALEFYLQNQTETFHALEQKAQQTINVSGIIVAITSGFSAIQPTLELADKIILSLVLLAFGYTLYHAIMAVRFKLWKLPVSTAPESIAQLKRFLREGVDEVYHDTMFESYLESINHNDENLALKRRSVQKAMYGVYFEMAITLIIAVLTIWF